MTRLAIVGYCQTVGLLNALGSWREALRTDSTALDRNVSAPLGWEDINTEGTLFNIDVNKEFRTFRGSKFCLLNSSTHPAAQFKTNETTNRQEISSTKALNYFVYNASGLDIVVSVLNGSEQYLFYAQGTWPEYDFFPYDEVDADYQPIDAAYVAHWSQHAVSWVEASLGFMRHSLPNKKIIHVAPPPPNITVAFYGEV